MPLSAVLHSSTEPGQLLLRLCSENSIINIVIVIIIIIVIVLAMASHDCCMFDGWMDGGMYGYKNL